MTVLPGSQLGVCPILTTFSRAYLKTFPSYFYFVVVVVVLLKEIQHLEAMPKKKKKKKSVQL